MTLQELQLQIDDAERSHRSSVSINEETVAEILIWMKGVQSYLERKEKEAHETEDKV